MRSLWRCLRNIGAFTSTNCFPLRARCGIIVRSADDSLGRALVHLELEVATRRYEYMSTLTIYSRDCMTMKLDNFTAKVKTRNFAAINKTHLDWLDWVPLGARDGIAVRAVMYSYDTTWGWGFPQPCILLDEPQPPLSWIGICLVTAIFSKPFLYPSFACSFDCRVFSTKLPPQQS